MALVKSALFERIEGKMKQIQFRIRKNKKIELSKRRVPSYTRTEKQDTIRKRYAQLVQQWRQLSDEEKEQYNKLAEPYRISGWNYFVMINITKTGLEFDNGNGELWYRYINAVISNATTEEAVYIVLFDSTNVTIQNAEGTDKITAAIASEFWNNVKQTGEDIRIFDQNRNQMYFFIEEFDYINKTAKIYVKLPQASTEMNIAYGNSLATMSNYNNAEQVFEFFDDFEEWAGWTQYGDGVVTQSSEYARYGQHALKKDSYCDPCGGLKQIRKTLGRNIVFEAFILRDFDTNCNYDRIGLIDEDGNGYGLGKNDSIDELVIDKRSVYSAQFLATTTAITSNKKWYNVKLIIKETEIIAEIIDDNNELKQLTVSDTEYEEFTRVYIFGGYPYFVDTLKIYKITDPANFETIQIQTL